MPKSVREILKLKSGDRVDFVEIAGRIILRAHDEPRLADLAGSLSDAACRPLSLDEMDEAIGVAVGEEDRRIRSEWHDGLE